MQNNIDLIKLTIRKPEVLRAIKPLLGSMDGFQVIKSDDARKPDLWIVDTSGKPEEIRQIHTYLEKEQGAEVFLTSENPDPSLLVQAIRTGVREFLPQPLKEEEIRSALQRFKDRKIRNSGHRRKPGSVISVVGSKGGVGTTTIAINLAMALSRNGATKSVALMDMNTLFGDISLMLDISPKFDWGDITRNVDRLDTTFLMNVITEHPSGLFVLPSPAHVNSGVNPPPEVMERILTMMKGMFDFIVVDVGQSIDETAFRIFQTSETVLVTAIPSLPCLANTNKLLKTMAEQDYRDPVRYKVVLNRCMKKSDISRKDAETSIGRELFWTLPNDYKTTMEAINNGTPLFLQASKSTIARSFRELSELLNPEEVEPAKGRGLFYKLFASRGNQTESRI